MHPIIPLILNQSIQQAVERSRRSVRSEIGHPEERTDRVLGARSEAVVSNQGDEKDLAVVDSGALQLGEEGFGVVELAGVGEAGDDGEVGVEVVGQVSVEVFGIVEDLEGEVEVLLTVNDGDEAFW
ncbi:hypothetical protein Dimus_000167 [Dionaea muscipula]